VDSICREKLREEGDEEEANEMKKVRKERKKEVRNSKQRSITVYN